MPNFIDHHPLPGPVNPSQVLHGTTMQALKAKIQAGKTDEFGVRVLNCLISKDELYCLLEAPDLDSVFKFHEGQGTRVRPGDVTEVASLL